LSSSNNFFEREQIPTAKLPRLVLDGIFAFPPNRDTLGGTAYFIVERSGNILVDCPAWSESDRQFCQNWGGVRWLFITHRGGIGKAEEIVRDLGCQILIQEQEAYFLPELTVTTFQQDFALSASSTAIWTPGHSPGSSCLYCTSHGGVLFSGRHLLPDQHGDPIPLRTSKTFHWPRQLKSVRALCDCFTPATCNYLCPGANTGLLRGRRAIDRAYERLSQLDLEV
jgi:glyoxylase-like metal-dependent hydrolase (beta-lactamase superfamily II)